MRGIAFTWMESRKSILWILLKLRIFQLGLSVMAANGLLPKDYEMQDLMEILSSTAEDVIRSARLSKSKF